MKLGLVSAILEHMNFEEVIDFAAEHQIDSLELACWPAGVSERRYAGVSHLDVKDMTPERVEYIQKYCADRNVEISSLAYYPNPMTADQETRQTIIDHLKLVIKAANLLGIEFVATFIGRDQYKSVAENLKDLPAIWKPIMAYAEELNVKIAIENCPMLFTEAEWPGGQNLMTTPAIWRQVFEILDSDYIGLNYDPSHLILQHMDYIQPLYEFKDKIFLVHFKDIKLFKDKINEVGVFALPLEFMTFKLPGYGDVDWYAYVSALSEIGFRGHASVEVEDKAFEDTKAAVEKAVIKSVNYMRRIVY